jgi:hypothetical protein
MPTVHVSATTHVSAEKVLRAGRDFSARRAEMWPDVHVEHLEIHDSADTWIEVTEANPWPIGLVWERLRYDWSESDRLTGVVVASNLFAPGSTWELRAREADGATLVEIVAVRHLRGRGLLLFPFFPLGLAKSTVAAHLRHFIARVEEDGASGR